jgi:CHRD domain-containing protein
MRRMLIGSVAALAALALGATALIAGAGGAGGRAAATSDKALFATLTGTAEIGNDGQRAAGDRDGKGAASVLVTASKVCFGIQVSGLDKPAAAHIHQARAGQNGAIVIPLKSPSVGNPGAVAGCVSASATLRGKLKSGPSGFYVNVHTQAFPSGAIRGQLHT